MFACQEDTMNEIGLSTGPSSSTGFNQVYQAVNPSRTGSSTGYSRCHQQIENDGLRRWSARRTLTQYVHDQKRLVEVAASVLDTPSAVKLVRTLLPRMLSEPFADLKDEIVSNAATVEDPAETDPSALIGENEQLL
jgi:hypothetical protein